MVMVLLLLAGIAHGIFCCDTVVGIEYSAVNDVQKVWTRGLVAKVKQHAHTYILDIGCGMGEITVELAQKHMDASVLGIDPNESMLQDAQQKFAHVCNIHFAKGRFPDFFNRLAQENVFSGITSFSVLHWLSYINLKNTLDGAYTKLKTDGRCYFLLSGRQDNDAVDNLTQAVGTAIQDPRWANNFKKDDIDSLDDTILMMKKGAFSDLATKAGFIVEEIQLKEEKYPFASVNEFRKWLEVMSPYKEIVKHYHDDFVNAVLNNYLKISPAAEDGSVIYTDYMLNVILKK